MNLRPVDKIALILVIIGAVTWLLVGLFDFNWVSSLFSSVPVIARIIFIVVGLSGLYLISLLFAPVESHVSHPRAHPTSAGD